ncbi:hypothetical protein DL93DRAFT_2080586, partial [Clavulina sp. PMI_390]
MKLPSHQKSDIAASLCQHGGVLMHLKDYSAAHTAFKNAADLLYTRSESAPAKRTLGRIDTLDGRARALVQLEEYGNARTAS